MKFVDFVSREAIRTSIDVDDKEQVIRSMATALLESGKISEDQHTSIVEALLNREVLGGAGLGHHLGFEVTAVHGFEIGDNRRVRKSFAQRADAVEAFGEDQRGARFEPVDPGAEGECGGVEGFIDGGEVEGNLNDGSHGMKVGFRELQGNNGKKNPDEALIYLVKAFSNRVICPPVGEIFS